MIQYTGIVWDKYLPSVEGQLTRDLIAMQSEGPRVDLKVICPDASADRLLAALGIERDDNPMLAKLWITYRTQKPYVEAPEYATTVIDRDLYVAETNTNKLDPHAQPGYYMKPQGRIIPPSVNLNKPMPGHFGPTDPMLVYLWSHTKKTKVTKKK